MRPIHPNEIKAAHPRPTELHPNHPTFGPREESPPLVVDGVSASTPDAVVVDGGEGAPVVVEAPALVVSWRDLSVDGPAEARAALVDAAKRLAIAGADDAAIADCVRGLVSQFNVSAVIALSASRGFARIHVVIRE